MRTDNLSQFLDNLDRGTRCYREREVLRRVLRRFGPMSQERFDEIFGDDRTFVDPVTHHTYTRPRRLKIRFAAVNSRAIILGPNAPGEWGQWLHLIQIMTLLGEVRAGIRDKGKVWYWLGEEEWDRGRQRNADGQ